MKLDANIFLAGHKGMVGSAILRLLQKKGYNNILVANKNELNLLDQSAVQLFFENKKPEYVILAAAKVGGIFANMEQPASFMYENLQIQNNIIHSSYLTKVEKFVFLGTSCIYPKECPQPMKEEFLLSGKLEPTNEGYALAKIAGLKMCEFYKKQHGLKSISLMPCNLYGPNDSFDPKHSHVLSALIKKFIDAVNKGSSQVELWGTGIAKREFMHVDDMAEATLFMIENYHSSDFINVGWGEDISIKDLAYLISKKTGYTGSILWDENRPDGMLKKCMDITKMRDLGFFPKISLEQGIEQMINIYKDNI